MSGANFRVEPQLGVQGLLSKSSPETLCPRLPLHPWNTRLVLAELEGPKEAATRLRSPGD